MSTHTTPIETTRGTIAVRVDGRPDAPALLLCQRFRGGTEDWDPRFIAALARKRRVIRFDMPGIGASGGETPDSVQGMAAVVPALLDALGLERVDLLGWSLGGYVGQAATLTWPGRVRRLIIAGSGPGGPMRLPLILASPRSRPSRKRRAKKSPFCSSRKPRRGARPRMTISTTSHTVSDRPRGRSPDCGSGPQSSTGPKARMLRRRGSGSLPCQCWSRMESMT